MFSSAEVDIEIMFLTRTPVAEYEELCRLEILRLEDTHIGDQIVVQ